MKVTVYDNYHAGISMLPRDEQDAFYGSIMRYVFDGEEPEFEGTAAAIWVTIRPLIDKSVTGQYNGSKGGNGRGNKKDSVESMKGKTKTVAKTESETTKENHPENPPENPPIKPFEKTLSENQWNRKEGNGKENQKDFFSNSPIAPVGAAAARAAPPVACPECDANMERTSSTQGSKRIWRCPLCGTETAVEEVA